MKSCVLNPLFLQRSRGIIQAAQRGEGTAQERKEGKEKVREPLINDSDHLDP